jgi:hypothetical protein
LALNGERFDEYAGLPRGYLSKLVGAKPTRRLGMTSFSPVLAGLGLRCLFVVDEEAERRLRNRVPPRNSSYVRAAPSIVLTVRFFEKIGRKGAQARVDNSTAEQRREWARKAAIARWQKANPCSAASIISGRSSAITAARFAAWPPTLALHRCVAQLSRGGTAKILVRSWRNRPAQIL